MIAEQKEYHDLLLAAWLHDIGKFYQRAGFKLDSPEDENALTQLAKKHVEGSRVRYSHHHAIFSDKFFREYLPGFSRSGTLAALHHSPENAGKDDMRYLAKLIMLADWMASGERRERESEEDYEGYQAEPMVSIFSQLKIHRDEAKSQKNPSYIPLVSLEASLEELFPVFSKEEAFMAGDGQKSYEELWKRFVQDLEKIYKEDLLNQIPFLLEKFTLTIPSSTRDKPDLSLFHHLKSTAAIASCLYQLQSEEKIIDSILQEIKEIRDLLKEPGRMNEGETSADQILGKSALLAKRDFLLVGGDISGIQDFIYSVTSDKALKGLRARSFYLQLVSEVISRLILEEFNLTEANLLYCSGGHFYILVPKFGEAERKLEEIRRKIDEVLLKAHKGKLAMLLTWVPVAYADFFINFASLWTELGDGLGKIKKRKFSSLFASDELENYWKKIMGPFDEGGEKKACEICSEELEEEAEGICSLCQSFVHLSEDLNRAEAINLMKTDPEPIEDKIYKLTWEDVILAFGFKCRFWKKRKEGFEQEKEGFLKNYLKLNSTDFAGQFSGYKFVATKIAGPDGKTLTLEDMANAAEGIKRWGVLRADIDGLGRLFAEGLGEDKTISRMSMLSSMLSLYFGARLNHLQLLKENDDFKKEENKNTKEFEFCFSDEIRNRNEEKLKKLLNYIYIVYSGGDDLFLIGPWSVLPSLAVRIHDDFYRFTSRRLTLSAGLYLAPSRKFPIYQAAQEAGEAEGEAKKAGRNRISLLGKPLTWDRIKEVREIALRLKNLLEGQAKEIPTDSERQIEDLFTKKKTSKAVPRALLSILYAGYREKELRLKGEIPMERIWRLFYTFKKIMTEFQKEEEKLKELEWLLNKVITDYEIYPELNVAVRWAEYLTREEK